MSKRRKCTGVEKMLDPTRLPQELHNPYIRHLAKYQFASRYIKSGRVIDIGCGSGFGTAILAENGTDEVVGIDIGSKEIAYAKSHFIRDNLEYLIMDGTKLEYPKEFFDFALSIEVIEHVSDYKSFLNQIARVLKKDGLFILSTPNKEYPQEFSLPISYCHIKEFNQSEFKKILLERFSKVEMWGEKIINQSFIKYHQFADSYRSRIPKLFRRAIRRTPYFLNKALRNLFIGVEPPLSEKDIIFDRKEVNLSPYFVAICKK